MNTKAIIGAIAAGWFQRIPAETLAGWCGHMAEWRMTDEQLLRAIRNASLVAEFPSLAAIRKAALEIRGNGFVA